MLVNMKDVLENAKIDHYCIPHFNINNLEWTRFILEEANQLNSPIILGASEGAVNYMGGYKTVTALVKALVSDLNITVPVVLHLDHGKSIEACKKAIDAGFTSVMIDASKETLETNIAITSEVVEYAHNRYVTVEAEIGHIGGTEDDISSDIAFAKLDDCITFVKETQIDCLAPALGSVHGLYKGEPKFDFELMKKIAKETKLPLVLHGGTGIDDVKILEAIKSGVCKININTELQLAWTEAIRNFLTEYPNIYDPRKIIKAGEIAMKEKIAAKIKLFNSMEHQN